MNIAVEQDVTGLEGLAHHHFGRAVLRALLHTGSYPLSIQVKTRQRGPVITNNDAVRVQHGNDFEYEVVS